MTSLLRHKAKTEERIISSQVSTNPREQSTRVAIIREELVALTGDPLIAVVLNQLLYWTQRVTDFDLLVKEENTPDPKNTKGSHYGWFYKSARELSQETMICVSKVTMRRYLNLLIEKKWLQERSNPQNKWDRTTQYRLNLRQIQIDLQSLGWGLPGFPEGLILSQASKLTLEGIIHKKPKKTREPKNEPSKVHQSTFEGKASESSKVKNCNFIYLTETTSKTTNKEHTQRTRKNESDLADENLLSMIELWKKHIGQDEVHLTKNRKAKFKSLMNLYFQNDPSKWKVFCKRIKASSFLMGEGFKKWHISFDWILRKGNVLKVIEGNFDNPEEIQQRKEATAKIIRQEKTQEILESIQDPYWREWCSQLSEFPPDGYSQVNKPLYWWQLERIANARFLDFDGRLVVIGSSDPKVLDEIENNRFQLASIAARTFPTSRTIRTELSKEGAKSSSGSAVPSKSSPLKRLNFNFANQQEGINHAE